MRTKGYSAWLTPALAVQLALFVMAAMHGVAYAQQDPSGTCNLVCISARGSGRTADGVGAITKAQCADWAARISDIWIPKFATDYNLPFSCSHVSGGKDTFQVQACTKAAPVADVKYLAAIYKALDPKSDALQSLSSLLEQSLQGAGYDDRTIWIDYQCPAAFVGTLTKTITPPKSCSLCLEASAVGRKGAAPTQAMCAALASQVTSTWVSSLAPAVKLPVPFTCSSVLGSSAAPVIQICSSAATSADAPLALTALKSQDPKGTALLYSRLQSALPDGGTQATFKLSFLCSDGSKDSASVNTDKCRASPFPCDGRSNGRGGTRGICTNTAGGYTCKCSEGFDGDGKSCRDIDECKEGPYPCDPRASQEPEAESESESAGPKPIRRVNLQLTDSLTRSQCTNTIGGFTCACVKGFDGDGVTCEDMDECKVGINGLSYPCDTTPNEYGNNEPRGQCTNTVGGYSCQCTPNEWFGNAYEVGGCDHGGKACFPAHATVQVATGGAVRTVRMDQLRIGDKVLAVDRTTGAPVYRSLYAQLVPHAWQQHTYDFVSLKTSNGFVLQLTGGHYVPVCTANCEPGSVQRPVLEVRPAGGVRVGDRVQTLTSSGGATQQPQIQTVVHIWVESSQGKYAPLIKGADLVVDGVVASPFCALPIALVHAIASRLPASLIPAFYEALWAPLYAAYRLMGSAATARFTLSAEGGLMTIAPPHVTYTTAALMVVLLLLGGVRARRRTAVASLYMV